MSRSPTVIRAAELAARFLAAAGWYGVEVDPEVGFEIEPAGLEAPALIVDEANRLAGWQDATAAVDDLNVIYVVLQAERAGCTGDVIERARLGEYVGDLVVDAGFGKERRSGSAFG